MISDVLGLIFLLALVLAFLLWRDARRGHLLPPKQDKAPQAPSVKAQSRHKTKFRPEVLVDGSNVMHWKDNVAQLATLRIVLDEIAIMGYCPGVIFDANAGYKLFGHYRDDGFMARSLGLHEAQVLMVPKGEPADRFLLAVSRSRSAPIVTNDRYRDWVEEFPEIARPGRLLRGGFRGGRVWLDLQPFAAGPRRS